MDNAKPGQAHPSGDTGKDVKKDASVWAKIWHRFTRIANGYVLGYHETSELKRAYEQAAVGDKDSTNKILLPDELILRLAAEIKQKEILKKETEEQYPGYDTRKSFNSKHSNHFKLDRSESSISIGVSSSTGTWLNASPIQHTSLIRIEIQGPNGRNLVCVDMSLDQFASALVSNSHTPCTVSSYWSVNDDNVRLQERVKPPESVTERMRQRLADSFSDNDEIAKKIQSLLESAGTKGKMGKKDIEELSNEFSRYVSHRQGNASFVVEQALEETAAIVETAAAHIALSHNIPIEDQQKIKRLTEGKPQQ